MKLAGLLVFLLFAGSVLAQSGDPFVGTWVYSADKSPRPTITYAIRDLGGDRYALTGSTGETTEIQADGRTINTPSGDAVSFRKVDAHTWHMDRVAHDSTLRLARTYTVSADDRQLTLTDVFSQESDVVEKTVTQYHRTEAGKSLYGKWKSFAMKETVTHPAECQIAASGADGFLLTFTPEKHRVDLLFDGKPHVEQGPTGPLDQTISGARTGSRSVKLEMRRGGNSYLTAVWTVAGDGTTLTMVEMPTNSPATFTSVWERR